MRKEIVRITTADTKNTYELPGEDVPQLWEAKLTLTKLNISGAKDSYGYSPEVTIYLEQQTLVNARLTPKLKGDEAPTEETQETAEELILRLLEMVGVYPAE